jgi:hypothetical protein
MGREMSKRIRAPHEEPARSNRSRQVSELLPSVGGAAFRRFGFVQSSIVTRWPEIVGERLAAASSPESIKFPVGKKQDGTLTLVARGAHAVMIQHVTPEIMERVNLFFGYPAVAKVAIRQGEVAQRPKPRPAPEPRTVPAELGQSLKTIEDPELKAVLEALAAGIGASSGLPVVR